MNWNDVTMELIQAVLPILVAALVALVGYGVAYLRKQTEAISNKAVRDSLNEALFEAERVATDAIRATNQTLVESLKEASQDGKLTQEEAMAAMERAKEYFLSHISAQSKDVLKAALGPINEWLGDYIEARLGAGYKSVVQPKVTEISNPLSSGPAA